ncbi:purine-nucleoside phosphorylase [bacterium]|nr:purine-nucleoside phosphorylase [bacterium]
MLTTIEATAKYILKKSKSKAQVGIILGTGLGGLVDEIKIDMELPYDSIPNFPVSTVEGHKGKLIFGTLGNKEVVAMQGRFHYYEGYGMDEVTFPVRVMKKMGIESLFVSNASGGLNPTFKVGDIMIINDHINMFGTNPLIGKNHDSLGPRFPDMSEPYSKKLIAKAFDIANNKGITVQQGSYVGTSGPTFETPAEYKMFRILGGDAVGMSTVPEIIVARHMNMTCFGISIITDSGVPGEIVEISHEEVQEVAAKAQPFMALIMKELIASL